MLRDMYETGIFVWTDYHVNDDAVTMLGRRILTPEVGDRLALLTRQTSGQWSSLSRINQVPLGSMSWIHPGIIRTRSVDFPILPDWISQGTDWYGLRAAIFIGSLRFSIKIYVLESSHLGDHTVVHPFTFCSCITLPLVWTNLDESWGHEEFLFWRSFSAPEKRLTGKGAKRYLWLTWMSLSKKQLKIQSAYACRGYLDIK